MELVTRQEAEVIEKAIPGGRFPRTVISLNERIDDLHAQLKELVVICRDATSQVGALEAENNRLKAFAERFAGRPCCCTNSMAGILGQHCDSCWARQALNPTPPAQG